MRDRPTAADLLDIAREVLQQKILPALPAALRYDGLMIVNALANAQREIERGAAPLGAELARLAKLLGEALSAPEADRLTEDLTRLNRRFAAEIRAGRFDGDAAAAEHLLTTALDAVRESNPKYLSDREL
ncbi:MAG TPA: DUF6285 domain-containing protein [Alphaproteobacteria bacterium]|nr:DUF6285 domain-containing protein [Alphaproteobacteria bacterium]